MLPLVGAALAPLIAKLTAEGLGTIAEAVAQKGKDKVEDLLGVKLDDKLSNPAGVEELKAVQTLKNEELRIMLEDKQKFDAEITARWTADNVSSALARNIRPVTLAYLLVIHTAFALLAASGAPIPDIYAETNADMLYLVIAAYFGLRTVEKWRGAAK